MTIDQQFLLILKSDGIGEAEPDLAAKLMGSFLKMLGEAAALPARIVFMNSAIFLTTEGSPAIAVLEKLRQEGVELLSCATCLDYYGRKDKLAVGQPTNMRETVNAMIAAAKVIVI